MKRDFISLNIAIVAVSEDSIANDQPSQLVIDRLTAVGHRFPEQSRIDDSVQLIRAKLLEHVADPSIDCVIVIAGMQSESAGIALDPLITRSLHGFSDLLRMIAYQELGSAAMLVEAEAAQCKSTFVFLVPGSIPALRIALDKLLVPQLDYRTWPRNIVMSLPRAGHTEAPEDAADAVPEAVPVPAPIVDTNKALAPWIVPRAPGAPPPPPRPTAPPPMRKSMSMSVAEALPKASVSDIVERTAVSVSQRMPAGNPFSERETTNVGPPPPPPPLPRGKISSTISTPLPNKPPAKLIPLAALLPIPTEPDARPTPVEIKRGTTVPPANAPNIVVDKELSSPVTVEPARKMASLADLDDEGDDLDELENSVAEIIDEPPRDQPVITAVSRAPRASVAPTDLPPRRVEEPFDNSPRRIAEPRVPRRRDGRKLALLLLGILLVGATSALAVVLVRRQDHEAQAAGEPPPKQPELVANRDPVVPAETTPPPTVTPLPPPTEALQPPPGENALVPPNEALQPPPGENAVNPPNEIEIVPQDPTPTTTSPRTPRTPRTPRPPVDPALAPVRDPADVLATAPVNKVEDGCDEVSCILDHFKQPCCARFKPAEPDPQPVVEKPSSGLPEKLDKLMVQEGMSAVKPAVIACGEQIATRGTVKISMKVSGGGKVISVSVASAPDDALGKCVAAAAKLAKFPETDDGGSFSYPFVF